MVKKTIDILKKDWIILLLMLATFFVGIYFYQSLPERVPSHWNIRGEIDGYSSRFFGAFGLPLINFAMYISFVIMPYLDPKRRSYDSFSKAYRTLRFLLHIFLMGIYIVTIYAALGNQVQVDMIVKAGIAVLFIFLGNIMGKFKSNYFVGIKTPWTLANDEVWRKTHRLSATIWVIGGLVMLGAAFIKGVPGFIIFFTAVMGLTLIPAVYSYIIYRKIVG